LAVLGALVPAGLLVILALLCLVDRHLRRACLAFVGFALMMALSWWRLGLPWIAIAEALLGALLTGLALGYTLVGGSEGVRLPARDLHVFPPHQAVPRLLMSLGCSLLIGLAVLRLIGWGETPQLAEVRQHAMLLPGYLVMTLGLWAFVSHAHLLRRLLAFNVLGSGIFLLVSGLLEHRAGARALIVTGLVVALLGSLLGALLIRRLHAIDGRLTLDGETGERG
jgi:uncharacterized MnhB-related membrane protein